MIIQHNIMALNAYNRLSGNNSLVSKNLEKLSSGYKINRAGDDAAGLAISEKMRAQITGLERATNNAQDGISLVQTAEGALTEVHAMLNRMVDLATQASNGTYDNDVDRLNLEKEVTALKDEINRVASSTNFNGIKLLDGSLGSAGTVSTAAGTDPVVALADASGATGLDISGAKLTEGATALNMTVATFGGVEAETTIDTDGSQTLTVNLGKTSKYNNYVISLITSTGGDKSTATVDERNKIIEVQVGTTLSADINTDKKVADLVQAALNDNISDLAGGATVSASNQSNAFITGTLTSSMFQGGKEAGQTITISDSTKSWETTIKQADYMAGGTFTLGTANFDADGTISVTLTGGASSKKIADVTEGTGATTTIDFTGKTGKEAIGTTVEVGGTTYEFVKAAADVTEGNTAIVLNDEDDAEAIITALTAQLQDTADFTVTAGTGDDVGKVVLTSTTKTAASESPEVTLKGTGLRLQIGDTADQAVSVAVSDMSAKALGLDEVSVSNEKNAADSIALIKTAINTVSGTRADLGAIQNRLEHTVNNLTTTTENMTNAESRIRDTDVAKEMMAFTKNNVLSQAAQSMLAQANQQPQQVLQLLR